MDDSKPGKEKVKTPGRIRSEKNLIPARPGEPTRNKEHKNQYTWLRDSGIKVLEEMIEQGGKKKESLQLMLEKLRYEFLVKGNVAAGKELFDRVFGKACQSVDVTTNGKDVVQQQPDIKNLSPEAIQKITDAIITIRKSS